MTGMSAKRLADKIDTTLLWADVVRTRNRKEPRTTASEASESKRAT